MTIATAHDRPNLVAVTRNGLHHLLATTLYAELTSHFRIAWFLPRRRHQAICSRQRSPAAGHTPP